MSSTADSVTLPHLTATGRVTQAHVVGSEWTKLASLRSTKVMVACSVILGVALSVLLAIIVGETFDKWGAADQRTFDPIGTSLIGVLVSAIVRLGSIHINVVLCAPS